MSNTTQTTTSPTPWHTAMPTVDPTSPAVNTDHTIHVVDATGAIVCRCDAWPHGFDLMATLTRPDADSNAAYIVRACNAHDDLVAALLAVVAGAKNWSHGLQRKLDDGSKLTQWEETIRYNAQSMADMARAAIAKARGDAE